MKTVMDLSNEENDKRKKQHSQNPELEHRLTVRKLTYYEKS